MKSSNGLVAKILEGMGMKPIQEYRFHPTRRFRIDIAFPEIKLAIEIEGGIWRGKFGRHTNPVGFCADMVKYNFLTQFGWRLLRYQPSKVDYDQIKLVYDMLKEK